MMWIYMPALTSHGIFSIHLMALAGVILAGLPAGYMAKTVSDLILFINSIGMILYLGALSLGAQRAMTFVSMKVEVFTIIVFLCLFIGLLVAKNDDLKSSQP